MYFFVNKEHTVCGSCNDDLWPQVQREMSAAGLTQVSENEYEVVSFLRQHPFGEIAKYAEKWGFKK